MCDDQGVHCDETLLCCIQMQNNNSFLCHRAVLKNFTYYYSKKKKQTLYPCGLSRQCVLFVVVQWHQCPAPKTRVMRGLRASANNLVAQRRVRRAKCGRLPMRPFATLPRAPLSSPLILCPAVHTILAFFHIPTFDIYSAAAAAGAHQNGRRDTCMLGGRGTVTSRTSRAESMIGIIVLDGKCVRQNRFCYIIVSVVEQFFACTRDQ